VKDIQLFLLFQNFRYKLNSKSVLSEKDRDLKTVYKDFNDTDTEYWEIGKIYYIGNRKLFPCQLKNSKKQLYLTKNLIKIIKFHEISSIFCEFINNLSLIIVILSIFRRLIVEDINNLIIVEPELQDKGKILCNFRLKLCDISEINKYDPKRLTLRNVKEEKTEWILTFNDEKFTWETANFLNKNKRDIRKLEKALIIRILHQAENDLLKT